MHAATRLARKLDSLFASEAPSTYRATFILFLIYLFGSAGMMLWVGPYVQNAFGHDLPVYYAGAWKMLWGYKPHVDFHSPLGVMNFAFVYAGMKLTGVNAYSIATGNTLVFLIVSAVAWAVCRLRFAPVLCLIYTLFAGWMVMCAHYLRYDFLATAYAGLYNRQGYALLLVLMAQAFLPRKEKFAERALLDGAIFGAISVTLLFLKVTYFLAGAGIFALGLLLRNVSWRMLVGVGIGSILVALPTLIYFKFDLVPYYQDLAFAGKVRSTVDDAGGNPAISLISRTVALRYALEMIPAVVLLLLMCFTAIGNSHGNSLGRGWPGFFCVGATATISLGLLLTNSPLGDKSHVPLISALGLILLQRSFRSTSEPGGAIWRRAASCLIATLLILPLSTSAVGSFAYTAYFKLAKADHRPATEIFSAAPLARLIIPGTGGDPASAPFTYAQKINDALALLDQHVPRDATVETLDFTNLLPFAGQRPPARGPLFWQYRLSFTEKQTLSAERAFGDADVLMIPKYSGDPDSTVMLQQIYREYLAANYQHHAESDQWILLTRRPQQAAPRDSLL